MSFTGDVNVNGEDRLLGGGDLAGLTPKSSWAESALGDRAGRLAEGPSALERLLGSPSSVDGAP